jgi:hypothetical protein
MVLFRGISVLICMHYQPSGLSRHFFAIKFSIPRVVQPAGDWNNNKILVRVTRKIAGAAVPAIPGDSKLKKPFRVICSNFWNDSENGKKMESSAGRGSHPS